MVTQPEYLQLHQCGPIAYAEICQEGGVVLAMGQNFFQTLFCIRVSQLHFLKRLAVPSLFCLTLNAIVKY